MLWHIEETRLDILGSIHVMDRDPLALPRQIERAYARSRRIVFEYDFKSAVAPSLLLLPEGGRLSGLIPSSLFAAVRGEWAKAGLPESELEHSQPWLAALRLQLGLAALRGTSFEQGIDRRLWQRASDERKDIAGLEMPAAALAGFSAAPSDEQIRLLSYVAESVEESQAELDAMIAAWRAGLIEEFEPMLARGLERCPLMFEALIAGRNRAWMPRLIEIAEDKVPTLVVVGAIHCIGDRGVPSLIAKEGYRVTRLAWAGWRSGASAGGC